MFQHGTASCVEMGTSAGLHDLERVPGWLDFVRGWSLGVRFEGACRSGFQQELASTVFDCPLAQHSHAQPVLIPSK